MKYLPVLAIFCAIPATTASSGETIKYRYDVHGRLIRVERAGTVNNGVTANYEYDRANNRTRYRVAGSVSPPPP